MLRFGSWVGGDMDGNPDVHAKTIRETLRAPPADHRQSLLHRVPGVWPRRCRRARARVGISAALQARIEQYTTLLPGALERHARAPRSHALSRVPAARSRSGCAPPTTRRANHYESAERVPRDLKLIARQPAREQGRARRPVPGAAAACAASDFRLPSRDARHPPERRARTAASSAQGLRRSELGVAQQPTSARARLREAHRARRGAELRARRARQAQPLGVRGASLHCRHRYGTDADRAVRRQRARAASTTCFRCCCWRAGPDADDSASGDVPLDVAPLFESAEALERCGDVMKQAARRARVSRALDRRAATTST